jgi:hypothetical protein
MWRFGVMGGWMRCVRLGLGGSGMISCGGEGESGASLFNLEVDRAL